MTHFVADCISAVLDRADAKCERAKAKLPNRFKRHFNLERQHKLFLLVVVICMELLFRERKVVILFESVAWFILNLSLSPFYRNHTALLQIIACLTVKGIGLQVSGHTLFLTSLACGLGDTSLAFSLLKLIMLTSARQWREAVFCYTMVIIPLQGFGQRAVVGYYLQQAKQRTTQLVFNPKKALDLETSLFFWLLPSAFVIAIILQSSFISNEELSSHYAAILAVLGLCTKLFGDKLNKFFFPVAEISIRYVVEKQTEIEQQQQAREEFQFRLLVSFSSFGFFSLLIAKGEYFLAIPYLLTFFSSLSDVQYPVYIIGSRPVLLFQFATLMVVLLGRQGADEGDTSLQENLIFFFSLTRALAASCAFSFEDISSFASEGAFTTSILVLYSKYPFQHTFLFLVSIACFFIELLTRLGGKKVILKEREAQNFVDHAIKQKFAGTGTALEIALADETFCTSFSADTIRVLRVALSECHLGTLLCHEATLKRQILDQTFHPKPVARRLSTVLAEWRENWKEVDIQASETDEEQWIVADWNMIFQIFQGLYCRARHHDRSFKANMKVSIQKPANLNIKVWDARSRNVAHAPQTCELFADRLGGTFRTSHGKHQLIVPITFDEQQQSIRTTSKGSESIARSETRQKRTWSQRRVNEAPDDESARQAAPELPHNLLFAVLDDSAMIRVNLKFTLLRSLGGSLDSIFVGDTEEQALGFCHLCTEINPDIVILDENLDYTAQGGSLILGSSVAVDLRTAGYQGVIVIHSANELLRDSLDYTIVDGFIIKGANRVIIKNELAHLLALKHRKRNRAAFDT